MASGTFRATSSGSRGAYPKEARQQRAIHCGSRIASGPIWARASSCRCRPRPTASRQRARGGCPARSGWCYLPVLAGLAGRRQSSTVTWRARATVSLPGGTECTTVEPAAIVAPSPDRDGRHQHAVGAGVGIVTDHGAVLVGAVVVGNDGAGADVDARADLRITDVREVIGLGAITHLRVLHLDEIADVHFRRRAAPRDAVAQRARCCSHCRPAHPR